MSFTLKQLRYFVAVAESGSVIGAAQTLSISQSSVTEALKNLEADLGVNLFERHARGLGVRPLSEILSMEDPAPAVLSNRHVIYIRAPLR